MTHQLIKLRLSRALRLLGLSWLAVCGCQGEVPQGNSGVRPSAAATARSEPPAPSLQVIDRAGLEALLVFHPGKVALVTFWSVGDERSRESIPLTVELSRRFAAEGLVALSIACDEESNAAEALSFLQESGATFQNLRSVHGGDRMSFTDFQIDDETLPAFKLYDRQGKLNRTLPHAPDPAAARSALEQAVESLLKASPPDGK